MEVFGTYSFLARPRRETFLVEFAVEGMVMGIFSGSALSSPFSMSGNFLSSLLSCLLIAANGIGVFFGMVGCLGCGVSDSEAWASSFGDLASAQLERCLGAYPVDFASWSPPGFLDDDDIALEMSDVPNIWTGGIREDFSSIGGFEVAGAGFICLLQSLHLRVRSGERQKSTVTLVWSVAVLLCLFPGSCRPFSVLNSGVLLLLCRRAGLVI